MSRFEVLILGVGDTFSETYRPTSLVLSYGGFVLAIDCPDMYRGALRAASEQSGRTLTLSQIDHVLITHVHGDHMNGLEGVAFYKRFFENKKLQLITSPEVRECIWDERLKASMSHLWDGNEFKKMAFDSYFEYQPLSWEGTIPVGPFQIRARRTIHHVPTSALFIEAGGRSLGYSADTAFDPELMDFLEPANLIIHETNFGPGHAAYGNLIALPDALRNRMRLIHYADNFDTASSAIAAVHEGELLCL